MPGNPFAEEIERRNTRNPFGGELERKQRGESLGLADFLSRRFANNFLAMPQVAGDVASTLMGDLRAPARLLGREPKRYTDPTVQDFGAALRSVPSLMPGGETPGQAFSRNRADVQAEEQYGRQAHPIASTAGDIGGDVMTLMAGRFPFAKKIQAAERVIKPATQLYFSGAQKAIAESPGVARLATRVINSPAVRTLGRGVFRAGETGFEAAVLESLKGDDPLSSAGFAVGGQMAGSLALTAGKGLLSGGIIAAGLKTTIAAGSIMGLAQLLKSATPGGRDRILESAETGYNKVALTLALGAASGMLGAARFRDTKLAEDLPRLVDAFATIPRGITLSVLTRWNDADATERQQIENALTGLSSDPEYQGESEVEQRIVNEFRNRNPFSDELERRQ